MNFVFTINHGRLIDTPYTKYYFRSLAANNILFVYGKKYFRLQLQTGRKIQVGFRIDAVLSD